MAGVAIILQLPDGSYALQRRTELAATAPGTLGFFGGHVKEVELPLDAALREINEETDLHLTNQDLEHIVSEEVFYETGQPKKMLHVFLAKIKDGYFKVREGVRVEVLSLKDLEAHADIANSTRDALRIIRERKLL